MKTIKKVSITPEFVETMPDGKLMKEGVIYISIKFNVAIHLCLCGCKIQTVTPFNEKHGWELSVMGDKVTLTPSIGNQQFPCKSHYIITKGIANFV